MIVLDKIKRKIQRLIGRCITEEIRDDEAYIDYMFKQYTCPHHGAFYVWNKEECFMMIDRIK